MGKQDQPGEGASNLSTAIPIEGHKLVSSAAFILISCLYKLKNQPVSFYTPRA